MPRVIRDTLVSVRDVLITGGPFIVLTAALLDARPDLELVAVAAWQGSESRLYRFRRK